MDILTILVSVATAISTLASPVSATISNIPVIQGEIILENTTYIADSFYFSDATDIESKVPLCRIHLLHYDFDGNIKAGELIVNSSVAKEVTEIFYELYLNKYPVHSVKPISEFNGNDEDSMSANNSSAYNYRTIAGTNKLSMHAKGVAIDINPLFNPCVTKNGISPKSGSKYADRSKVFPGKIDKNDLAYKLFTKAGWTWGGNWKSLKDYQHFEKNI